MTNPKFEIFQSEKNQKYYFRLKARNGEVILSSQGYAAKSGCQNGIASVQKNAGDDNRYVRKETDSGHSFNLKAGNGEVIGRSEVYKSASGMENGINSVKTNGPDAPTLDTTE